MVGSSDSRTCRRCSLSLHSGPSPDSWFRRASANAGNLRPVAPPADQGPGLSLAVTGASSASSDFPPEEPTADRVPVREISSEEGNRLLRIVPPAPHRPGVPAAGADRGCCPPRACRCRIAEVTCTSPDRVRDVVHNFDADGFDALYPRYRGGRPATFSADQRAEITKVARGRPTDNGLPDSTLEPAEAGRAPGRQGGGRQGVADGYQPPWTGPAAGPGGRVRSTGAERRRPRPTRTTRPRRTGCSSCLRSPTLQRRRSQTCLLY